MTPRRVTDPESEFETPEKTNKDAGDDAASGATAELGHIEFEKESLELEMFDKEETCWWSNKSNRYSAKHGGIKKHFIVKKQHRNQLDHKALQRQRARHFAKTGEMVDDGCTQRNEDCN